MVTIVNTLNGSSGLVKIMHSFTSIEFTINLGGIWYWVSGTGIVRIFYIPLNEDM